MEKLFKCRTISADSFPHTKSADINYFSSLISAVILCCPLDCYLSFPILFSSNFSVFRSPYDFFVRLLLCSAFSRLLLIDKAFLFRFLYASLFLLFRLFFFCRFSSNVFLFTLTSVHITLDSDVLHLSLKFYQKVTFTSSVVRTSFS